MALTEAAQPLPPDDALGQAIAGARTLPKVTTRHQIYINIFWFANNVHWTALLFIVLPSQIEKLLGPYKELNTLLVLSGGTFLAFIVNPLAGALSDYIPLKMGRRRPLMLAGTAVNVLALLALAFTPDVRQLPTLAVPLMAIFFVLVQFTNNVSNAPWSAIIADTVPPEQRGAASGWYGVAVFTGTIVGAGLAGQIVNTDVDLATYRQELLVMYIIIIAMITIAAIASWLLVKEAPLPERVPIVWSRFFAQFKISPRKQSDFIWVLLTGLIIMMGIWAIGFFLLYYYQDVINVKQTAGIDPSKAVLYFLVLVMFTAAFTSYFGGKLSDRYGRKLLVYIAGTLMTVVALVFIFFQSFPASLVAAACYGIGYGAYTSVDWALVTDALPSADQYGKDMGLWSAMGIIPQVFGIIAGAAVLNFFRPFPHHLGYTILFALTVLFFAAGTFFIRQVKGVR
jgi:MFS family permease